MANKVDILIASDHAGFELKKVLYEYLKGKGYSIVDYGPHEFDPEDDYPDYVVPLAQEISQNTSNKNKGIVIGASGQGEAIASNRFPGVRAMVYIGEPVPRDGRKVPSPVLMSREHNDANILSLGARFLSEEEAKAAVDLWLETPFSGQERHLRRLRKIDSFHCDPVEPSDADMYRML